MRVAGRQRRTITLAEDGWSVEIIDQTRLPHELATIRLTDATQVCRAIRDMQVRGAPLIGVAAAYGLALAMRDDPSDDGLAAAAAALLATRPTAVNLRRAIDDGSAALRPVPPAERERLAYDLAATLAEAEVAIGRAIGEHGLALLRRLRAPRPIRVLTHCNAGWLCTVDWGTALAPVYAAHDAGLAVAVWVSETRPRNQGLLTVWELAQHGVPHTLIADNAAGHLLQRGAVDLLITGTDRTTASGDVCNKVGTYLKALAARAHSVPFYVAAPESSIDWSIEDGVGSIPIEERSPEEVTTIAGRAEAGTVGRLTLAPPGTAAANPAFDVTPAALVTGFITERGICAPAELRALYGK